MEGISEAYCRTLSTVISRDPWCKSLEARSLCAGRSRASVTYAIPFKKCINFFSRNEQDELVHTRIRTKTDGPRFPAAVERVGIST